MRIFAFPSQENFHDLKVEARSEIFFTQIENCYVLKIPEVEPSKIQIELPELPFGTKFTSSKKEEFIDENNIRGTQISLWFTFSDSGLTSIPPLFVRILGEEHYFEFEPIFVYENPALVSPQLEINFENSKKLLNNKQNSQKFISVKKGEKIKFTISLRYGTQILAFNWKIPKDSLFSELERFDFAKGKQKINEFTTESKKLATFEWQILKDGDFALPEISVETISFNGEKKQISLSSKIFIRVSDEKSQNNVISQNQNNIILQSAFAKIDENESREKNSELSRENFEKIAKNSKRSIFDRIFSRKFAIFAGGEIFPVPEEKIIGQNFSGGQKVRIVEKTKNWTFIESEEFSGWTKNDNIFEIK